MDTAIYRVAAEPRLLGYEAREITAWFSATLVAGPAIELDWLACPPLAPLRCVRLGVRFDAVRMPIAEGLRVLDRLRAAGARPGPVVGSATRKAYVLIPAGKQQETPTARRAGAGVCRLSEHTRLWLPSVWPSPDEPVWWLNPPAADGDAVPLTEPRALAAALAA